MFVMSSILNSLLSYVLLVLCRMSDSLIVKLGTVKPLKYCNSSFSIVVLYIIYSLLVMFTLDLKTKSVPETEWQYPLLDCNVMFASIRL